MIQTLGAIMIRSGFKSILLALIAATLSAADFPEGVTTVINRFNGTIHSNVEINYDKNLRKSSVATKMGDLVATENLYSYDERGNLTKEVFEVGGKINRINEYEHDTNGNVINSISRLASGEISTWYRYEYDDNNYRSKEIILFPDGSPQMWYDYKNDKYGSRISSRSFDKDGKQTNSYKVKYERKFDDNGNLISYKRFSNNEVTDWTESRYDDQNNVIELIKKDKNGSIVEKIESIYTYDSNHNIVRRIVKRGRLSTVNEYEFDEKNRLVKEIDESKPNLVISKEYQY